MSIRIQGTTVIDDSRNAVNLVTASVSSAATAITAIGNGSVNTYRGVLRIGNTASDQWGGISFPDSVSGTDSPANNYYFIGRGGAISSRMFSFHIPTASNYGSGSQPRFVFASTGSDELFTVQSSTGNSYIKGTLGVGTTSPSERLQVSGNVLLGNGNQFIRYRTASNWDYYLNAVNDDFSFYDSQSTLFFKAFYNGGGTGKYISFLNTLNVRNNGNVGIGTISPGQKLNVVGTGSALFTSNLYHIATNSGSTGQGMLLGYFTGSGGGGLIAGDGIGGQVNNLVFGGYNGSAWGERARLTGSGVFSATGDMRAPIFYDSNNTGFYVDPAGTSILSIVRLQGYQNSTNYFERVFSDGMFFPNGTANLAADIRLGNASFWGYIEVEITGTFSFQNTPGKLTKVFAVGVNPNGSIFDNESRVVDALGQIKNNIAIGNFSWDSANSTYRITISHIVSTANGYTVKVRMFTHSGGANTVFNNITISGNYTLAALPRQYSHYNERLGIATDSPSQALHVVGNILASGTIQAGSDIRIKDNIETIDDAINKVKQLRGVYYDRIDLDDESRHTGVIAQEVLEVLPEVVGGDEQSGYSVAYGHMVGLLIEAIKAQQTEIEQLKHTVCKLCEQQE